MSLVTRRQTLFGLAVGVAMAAAVCLSAPFASAANDDAGQILKAMSDYLAAQQTISASYDSDVEVITPDLQKIQFASSGTFLLNRPDQLHATRTGGYMDAELIFDGKTLTVFGKSANSYAQLDAPGSIQQLIETLRSHGAAIPGADLLVADVYGAMNARIIDAKHVGLGVVGGVECNHLAFRGQDVDWQLWVEAGANPIPRKLVITSKTVGAAPQYTLVINDWKTGVPADAAMFQFTPPAGAKKLGVEGLATLDEIPPGIPAKGQ